MKKIGVQPTVLMLVLRASVDVFLAALAIWTSIKILPSHVYFQQFIVLAVLTFACWDIYRGVKQWKEARR